MEKENEFNYNPEFVDDAISSVKNIATCVDSIKQNIHLVKNIECKVNVGGLGFVHDGNIDSNLSSILEYETIILEMKNEMENLNILNDFGDKNYTKNVINAYINGKITTEQFLDTANKYMDYLLKNDPKYYNALPKTPTITPAIDYLAFKIGITSQEEKEKLLKELNQGMAKYMIDNEYMYKREGLVEYIDTYNGIFAMVGLRMGYENKEFDQPAQGLYFGTRIQKLSVVDCCNLYDYAARSVGLDLYAFGAGTHHNYAKDIEGTINPTLESEYKAKYGDDYFTKAKTGDIIEKSFPYDPERGHLIIIRDSDENGYYTVENGKGMEYHYYTFEELRNEGYHISNMDAVFRNTTSGNIKAHELSPKQWKYIEGTGGELESIRTNYDDVFLTPKVYQEELGLDEEYIQKLTEQYNKCNKR